MKNNSAPPLPTAKRTGVVYKFSCPYPHREAEDYIGLTTTTINRRMTMHAQTGSIRKHFVDCHNVIPNRAQILDNIEIICLAENKQKLYIKKKLSSFCKMRQISTSNMIISLMFWNFINLEIFQQISFLKPALSQIPLEHHPLHPSHPIISLIQISTKTSATLHFYQPVTQYPLKLVKESHSC